VTHRTRGTQLTDDGSRALSDALARIGQCVPPDLVDLPEPDELAVVRMALGGRR
jgi:hypothetical protein